VRRAIASLTILLACTCPAVTANATTQSVTLHATLTPERLGQSTTVGFGFEIAAPPEGVPPPLTKIDVRYPGDLGIALSGLGLATCSAVTLDALGPKGCPAEAQMGYGVALVEIPVGPEIIKETAHVTIVRAPTEDGHLALLFHADGIDPVSAQIVFSAKLVPAPLPFGGAITVDVPLVPSLPGAPYVAVVRLRSTLGPKNIVYYERVRGQTVAYHPRGVLLPDRCPRGGFRFAADLSFQDGSHASAHTAVPCPARRKAKPPRR
jgi:hypothetical protein